MKNEAILLEIHLNIWTFLIFGLEEVHQSVVKAGEQAVFKLGLPRMHKELLEYVGRLKYRTSYR